MMFDVGPLCGDRTDGLWWFRVFGYGLHAADIRRWPLLFSERNGYRRMLHVGPWRVKWLSRNRPLRRAREEGGLIGFGISGMSIFDDLGIKPTEVHEAQNDSENAP